MFGCRGPACKAYRDGWGFDVGPEGFRSGSSFPDRN